MKYFLSITLIILSTVPYLSFGANMLETIKSKGEVRVCIWPDYYSISYKNPRTGKIEGVDIDMANALADSLGVKPLFIETFFSHLIKNMTHDICDIAMHGVGIRDDRKAFMDFTEPHLISGIYAIATKSHRTIKTWKDIDQANNIVAVQKGTYMEPVMQRLLKKASLSVVDSFKGREQEVLSGRADVFITDFPYGYRMSVLTQWAHLISPPSPIAPTPYAFAIPKGNPEWLQTVNQFVKDVKADGRLMKSTKKYGLESIIAP